MTNFSYIIHHYEGLRDAMKGNVKGFWDWKIKNASLIDCVDLSYIRKKYKKIDDYINSFGKTIQMKECFKNSGQLCMYIDGVDYVEGDILFDGIPIHHAWNSIDGLYFDITKDILFPDKPKYSEYVKVLSFNNNEHNKYIRKYKHWGGFMDEKYAKELKKKSKNNIYETYESYGIDKYEPYGEFEREITMGDKYLERNFGIPVNYGKFDKEQHNYTIKKQSYNEVAKIRGTPIIKNPKTLKGIDANVRAIGDKYGNLYIAKNDNDFDHGLMANELKYKNEINTFLYKPDAKNFKDASGIYLDNNFIMLYRLKDSNMFFCTTFELHLKNTDVEKLKNLTNILKNEHPQYKFFVKQ